MKHFFISYNSADRTWAEWIAWQLEEAGYTTVLQAWDFQPGSNFVLEMQRAATEAKRTIAVLSQAYLDALYTQPEWAAAFGQDPTGEKGTLLPVRVQECDLKGLLPQIIYVDLVGTDEAAAKDVLLAGVSRERTKPATPPGFPGGTVPRSVPEQPRFPGALPPIQESPLAELWVAATSEQQRRGCYAEYGRMLKFAMYFLVPLVIGGILILSKDDLLVHPTPTTVAILHTDTPTPTYTFTPTPYSSLKTCTPTSTLPPTPTDTPTLTPYPTYTVYPVYTPMPTDTPTPVPPTATPKPALPAPTPTPAVSPAQVNFEKGFDLFQQEKWDEAIAEFQAAIQLDPQFSMAYMGLGYSYVRKEEFGKAVEALEKYVQLNPEAKNRAEVAADIQEIRNALASQAAMGPCCEPLQPGKGQIWLDNHIGETLQVDISPYYFEIPAKQGDVAGCACPQLDPGHYTLVARTMSSEHLGVEFDIAAGQRIHWPFSYRGY